ncbi:DUF4815 domain-containing protein [Streptomyces sp. NBC_01456]|uniref:DUF6519 domain-containing protein n=1 Tax=unclassified Streptomyces TaxID=2593676 RepID=UPI002E2F82CE|nr:MULTISPECIES: DUF6519 domain-containing protein [unclassified Streptomyces]
MHGDFSRVTFDPAQRFSAVLAQQGRVQLDADINEQAAILQYFLRTLVVDMFGPATYPPDEDEGRPGGFGLDAFDGKNFTLGSGRMYVDGILCECDGTDYLNQPYDYLDPDHDGDRLPQQPFLAYLRVWERLVTSVEAPRIREVALGPHSPDTTARTRVMWQVCWLPLEENAYMPDMKTGTRYLRDRISKTFEPRGLLAARVRRPEDDTSPSHLSPSSGYRGPENQLYRVEVHQGGTAQTATFKWSRENGSVTLPIRAVHGPAVELETLGRDDKLGIEVGASVELVDDASVHRGASDRLDEPAPRLYTVQEIDHAAYQVVLDADPADDPHHPTGGRVPGLHPLLRRWDHGATAWTSGDDARGDGAPRPLREGEWLFLEDGIEIRFEPSTERPRTYRRGAYWLIPARVLTGDVEWPTDQNGQPRSRPPRGVAYHYAPLAVVQPFAAGDYQMVDLRVPIPRRR